MSFSSPEMCCLCKHFFQDHPSWIPLDSLPLSFIISLQLPDIQMRSLHLRFAVLMWYEYINKGSDKIQSTKRLNHKEKRNYSLQKQVLLLVTLQDEPGTWQVDQRQRCLLSLPMDLKGHSRKLKELLMKPEPRRTVCLARRGEVGARKGGGES